MASYTQLVKAAEAKRIQITAQQRRTIYKIYRDVATEYGRELARHGAEHVNPDFVLSYAKELKKQSRYMFADIQKTIQTGIINTASAVTHAQAQYWGSIDPRIMDKVRDHMSDIPQNVVNEIVSGDLYKDGNGLSARIWRYRRKYEKDIDYIINSGIIARKSAYELAKDLEAYVLPGAEKPWDWSKVYPGANAVVDYNAQRLARTACTHAYQMSFQRATVDNPFIVSYMWHSSNGGRVCPLCMARDGMIFDKGSVPLDHPNGMCIITAVIEMSYDDIADEIADWVNGGSNPGLDKWLG